ncbi:putative baseplate assembly protein [Trichothermofontia sp.]
MTVPAGTQVAALPLAGETEEVVFETEQDLLVTPVQLQALMVQDPDRDRYSDHSAELMADNPTPFAAFRGNWAIAHRLYLACDNLFTQPGPKALTLTLRSSEASVLAALPLTWAYWDGADWQPILGVIKGLSLQIDVNQGQVTVQPGTAIDAAGHRIQLLSPQTLALATFFPVAPTVSAIVVVLLAHNANAPDAPTLRVVRQTELGTYPATTHLRLVLLELRNDGSIRRTLPTGEVPPMPTWELTWPTAPAFAKTTVDGVEAAWLRIQLDNTPLPPGNALPLVGVITAQINLNRTGLVPDRAFFNNAPLDLSKDFYPFGEQPRFNDTFYFASREVFSPFSGGDAARTGQSVQIQIALNADHRVTAHDVEVAWEVWQGSRWQRLTIPTDQLATATFTQNGVLTLSLPAPIAPTTIAGESHYWLRARLSRGNYGEAAKTQERPVAGVAYPVYELVEASYTPPVVQTLTLAYQVTQTHLVTQIRTDNDFQFHNPFWQLQAVAKAGTTQLTLEAVGPLQANDRLLLNPSGPNLEVVEVASVNPLRQLVTLKTPLQHDYVPGTLVFQFFPMFEPTRDTEPALYVGCDRPFPNLVNTLYLSPVMPEPGAIAQSTPSETPAQVIWEYSSLGGWRNLGAVDTTHQFSEPGLLQFIGPVDFVPRSRFGRTLYWLRARWERGDFRVPPGIQRLLANTTWASQTTTFRHQNLGSSNGNPHLQVQTPQAPVLLGERLEVYEGETATTGTWTHWQGVPDFYTSGPHDRHYYLDRSTGWITFGDGQRGRVPPIGQNNIRITYATGGGSRGNRATQTVTELKTTVPYLDHALNWEAATGGAELESLDRARERGPKRLRHRGRAVTAADLADLAYEASPGIARVQVITPRFRTANLQWQPICHLEVTAPGEIRVQLTNLSAIASETIEVTVSLTGPGQQHPYAHQSGAADLALSYTVTPEHVTLGQDWYVTLTNQRPVRATGFLQIDYPGGNRTNVDVDIPAIDANQIDTAGHVEIILVPQSSERQPTPILALLDRVETYLRDRALPTLSLTVTEPDWAEVTVSTTVVPRTLTGLDRLHQQVNDALTYFLHPLTGGPDRQGWAFGRRPHTSDLYRIIEAMPNIDHVQSLTIDIDPPLTSSQLRRDRLLIYSGTHQIAISVDSS